MTNIVIKYMGLVSSLLCSLLGGFWLVESEHNQLTEVIVYFHFIFSGMQCVVWSSGERATCSRRFNAGFEALELSKVETRDST